jgi:hypothetical protein
VFIRFAVVCAALFVGLGSPAVAQTARFGPITLDTGLRNVCHIEGVMLSATPQQALLNMPEQRETWTDGYAFTARRDGVGLVFAVEPLFEEPPRALVWITPDHAVLGEIETTMPLAQAVRPAPNDPRLTPLLDSHAFTVLDWVLDGRTLEVGDSLYPPPLERLYDEWDQAGLQDALGDFELTSWDLSGDLVLQGAPTDADGRVLLVFAGQYELRVNATLEGQSRPFVVRTTASVHAVFDAQTGLLVRSTQREVISGEGGPDLRLKQERVIITTCRPERL